MFATYLRALTLCTVVAVAGPAAAETYANAHLLVSAETIAPRTVGAAETGSAESRPLVILDVRPIEAFAKGRIPGARQLDPQAVADPDSPVEGALRPLDEIAKLLGDLGVSAAADVVVYDDKGGFHAARIFWLLEYLGHRHVGLLDGGIQAWTAAGQTLETGKPEAVTPGDGATGRFASALTPRRHATADWILERQNDAKTIVIDVRPSAAFAEGHIPWAKNIPWKANLSADGTMKSAGDLRAHFEALGVTPDDNIVVHCQNGLASSHSYFALRLLGYSKVRTYHRSWSEWGAADDLPKASLSDG